MTRKTLPKSGMKTTVTEQFLLMATIVLLPLQNYFPTVGGASLGFILFAVLGAYLLMWRLSILINTSLHPIFLAGYMLVGIGVIMEVKHSSSGFSEVLRILLMILGGVFVAALCRDRRAFRFALYGSLLASGFLAVTLVQSSYGYLSSFQTSSFQEATTVREWAFSENRLGLNLNTRAFLIVQGVMVALAFALTTRAPLQRYIFLAIASYFSVASFLTMSRGGMIILVLTGAVLLYAHGVMQPKALIAAGLITVGILVWVPEAVFNRFTFSTENELGANKVEGRARIYGAAIEHLPEYYLTGVGISNFYGNWGLGTEFAHSKLGLERYVVGSHNCFIEVTIYWGLAGLLAFLFLVWQSYRYVPRRCGGDPLRLGLLAIAVTVFLDSLVTHTLYGKEFSLALGLLVAGSRGALSYPILRKRVCGGKLPEAITPQNTKSRTPHRTPSKSIRNGIGS